jgi:hypothetical protein
MSRLLAGELVLALVNLRDAASREFADEDLLFGDGNEIGPTATGIFQSGGLVRLLFLQCSLHDWFLLRGR